MNITRHWRPMTHTVWAEHQWHSWGQQRCKESHVFARNPWSETSKSAVMKCNSCRTRNCSCQVKDPNSVCSIGLVTKGIWRLYDFAVKMQKGRFQPEWLFLQTFCVRICMKGKSTKSVHESFFCEITNGCWNVFEQKVSPHAWKFFLWLEWKWKSGN